MSVILIVIAIIGMVIAFENDLVVVGFIIPVVCIVALVVRFIARNL
ncbi:hypothetical protein KAX17_12090 [Candidatus Bipolaricaulota bacterium]|nr:hypothetical protein [Candidatus Bipolaricaulota bacterium]